MQQLGSRAYRLFNLVKAILANVKAPEGMVTKLFAREPDVQDPTAITFDDQNRLYIAETLRFERGIEDNRRNPWVADDYKLTSTAERMEMLKKYAEKFPDKKPTEYFTNLIQGTSRHDTNWMRERKAGDQASP
jgi:hypothetical protein